MHGSFGMFVKHRYTSVSRRSSPHIVDIFVVGKVYARTGGIYEKINCRYLTHEKKWEIREICYNEFCNAKSACSHETRVFDECRADVAFCICYNGFKR